MPHRLLPFSRSRTTETLSPPSCFAWSRNLKTECALRALTSKWSVGRSVVRSASPFFPEYCADRWALMPHAVLRLLVQRPCLFVVAWHPWQDPYRQGFATSFFPDSLQRKSALSKHDARPKTWSAKGLAYSRHWFSGCRCTSQVLRSKVASATVPTALQSQRLGQGTASILPMRCGEPWNCPSTGALALRRMSLAY